MEHWVYQRGRKSLRIIRVPIDGASTQRSQRQNSVRRDECMIILFKLTVDAEHTFLTKTNAERERGGQTPSFRSAGVTRRIGCSLYGTRSAAVPLFLLLGHDGEGLPLRLGRSFRELLGDFDEQRLDVVGVLGRRFQVEDAVLGRVRVGLLELDLAPVFQVGLVARQRDDDVRVAPALQFLHPALGAGEGIWIRDVVHDDRRRRTAVVHGSEGPVAFLSGGIPEFFFN